MPHGRSRELPQADLNIARQHLSTLAHWHKPWLNFLHTTPRDATTVTTLCSHVHVRNNNTVPRAGEVGQPSFGHAHPCARGRV